MKERSSRAEEDPKISAVETHAGVPARRRAVVRRGVDAPAVRLSSFIVTTDPAAVSAAGLTHS